jgi:hypothetical protein
LSYRLLDHLGPGGISSAMSSARPSEGLYDHSAAAHRLLSELVNSGGGFPPSVRTTGRVAASRHRFGFRAEIITRRDRRSGRRAHRPRVG